MIITPATLTNAFVEQFAQQPTNFYFAPGRINLIGEHLDYNGGMVLPCAISLGTYAAIRPRTDQKWRLYSKNFATSGICELDLANLHLLKDNTWLNYVVGTLELLLRQKFQLTHGFDILIQGDLPNSAGLSSSASLELLLGIICQSQFNLSISLQQLALNGQQVENAFIGVNSGIMDQYAVALGRKQQALLLDTKTLTYQYVPVNLGNYQVVIMNSNQPRALAGSKYNERRNACETALNLLQTQLSIQTLCEVTPQQLDEYSYLLVDADVLSKARHVVWENQRTLQAQTALQQQDLTTFGHLLNASHVSLEQDFAVSGMALDTLVHAAWQFGALGARMTGAGFGGCAIAIVSKEQTPEFIQQVGQTYQQTMHQTADFYVAEIADGPHEIKEG